MNQRRPNLEDRVIDGALRTHGLVIVAILAVIGYGIYEYTNMPVDAFPDISPVMVPIFAEAHGMAPEEIERQITYPIETAMNGLPGVKQVKSTSAFGMAAIYVYFDDETSRVRHVSTHTQKPLPLEPSGDCGRMARAAADDERALLLAFLTKMSQSASPAERTALRTFVKETAGDLKWADQERKRLLGN